MIYIPTKTSIWIIIEFYRLKQVQNKKIHATSNMDGLVCLVLWRINLCRLFNAKSIFM